MELAVYADCKTLIERFVASGEHSFASFCTEWKSMKFQHIYSAQLTNVEVLQTTATALHVAKRIVCGRNTDGTKYADDGNELHRRIGGLYLLYAIYFKQPTQLFVKAEMALDTWRELKTFMHDLPTSEEMDEVRYVFWKLLQADAFRFTALDYCSGLEELVDFDKVDEQVPTEQPEEGTANKRLKHELHSFTGTQQLLPALTVLEDGYNEMKELLATTDKHTYAQSLPPTTIFRSISSALSNIQKILDEPQEGRAREARTTKQDESKKRNLKRKGYKTSEAGLVLEKDEEEGTEDKQESTEEGEGDEDNGTEKQRKNKVQHYERRMSARTVFAGQLPADLLADLQTDSEGETTENGEYSSTNRP